MRVLPTPRCAALMHSVSAMKGSIHARILKYCAAAPMVSSFAPASRISGLASGMTSAIMIRDRKNSTTSALLSVLFASSRRPSPFLRATTAVTPILSAMNRHNISIRGCDTSPTDAMADVPIVPTIMVSIEPIRLVSTISATLGSAMSMRFLYASRLVGSSPRTRSSLTMCDTPKNLASSICIHPPRLGSRFLYSTMDLPEKRKTLLNFND